MLKLCKTTLLMHTCTQSLYFQLPLGIKSSSDLGKRLGTDRSVSFISPRKYFLFWSPQRDVSF